MPAEFKCKVTATEKLTPTVYQIQFDTDQPLEFKAGQFLSVIVPGAGPGGRDLRRAYSIASPPQKKPIELCVKLVSGGPGTNYLCNLKVGDEFKAIAPYGDFVFKPQDHRHAFFIATGTGLAPFRSMIFSDAYWAQAPLSTTCMLGVHEESELLYVDEFENKKDVLWVATVSRPKSESYTGLRGRVTHHLQRLMDERGKDFPWTETDYYLCGNGSMIDEIKAMLNA